MDKRVIISDLDGTLGDYSHRVHLYKEKNYKEFNKQGINDRPIEKICNMLRALHDSETEVWVITAREETERAMTEKWLKLNEIPCDKLLMRPKDDQGHDWDVKEKLFESTGFDYKKVWFVLEDRTKCVDMWRGQGMHCLQVAPGDF
jgi:uncharacterized HAD superfamily protein